MPQHAKGACAAGGIMMRETPDDEVVSRMDTDYPSLNAARTRTQAAANLCPKSATHARFPPSPAAHPLTSHPTHPHRHA